LAAFAVAGQGVGWTLAIVTGGKFPWRDADVSTRDMAGVRRRPPENGSRENLGLVEALIDGVPEVLV
jgi:hypothetical protein